MYRSSLRAVAVRPALRTACPGTGSWRFASTSTASPKPRTWKSSVIRLGLAASAVYYYNTSPVFADEVTSHTIPAPAAFAEADLPTVDSVIEEKRRQIQTRLESKSRSIASEVSSNHQSLQAEDEALPSPDAVEQDAGQQGAFNPETGEINWDCACLGGMAHGPCGEEFKTAFSCFVYSEEEPKGMDCIEKFQGMQECFKKYPEVYGAELQDEEDDTNEDTARPPVEAPFQDQQALREQATEPSSHDEEAPPKEPQTSFVASRDSRSTK